MFSPTSDNGLLRVSGIDAKKFLQGQLTCDLELITPTNALLGAQCNPQGRVISLFRLHQHQDIYYLFMSRQMVPITLSALKKYAVFFKVELIDASDEMETLANVIKFEPYRQITQGVPAIYPETSGKFLPHDLNLHELHAISFHKGCYTGQEIIARMHYKAAKKNHLYHALIESSASILPGTDVYFQSDNDKHIVGTIVDALNVGQQHHVLLITDINHAKTGHLFLKQHENVFLHILNENREII